MIRIGIIGAGPNAASHAHYFHDSPRARVVAVADPDAARARALAGETDARPLADYREFLGDVDAVVVSSPNFLHREHASAAAQAGLHVFCEKPMGLSLAEAEQIAGAVEAARVRSTVGFAVRFDPIVQTMLRLAREGALGGLVSLCSRRLGYIPLSPDGWRSDPARSGGLLLEINIHELDWMMAVGGDVRSVYARTWAAQPNPRANDHLWVTLDFAGGAVGMHEGSWLATNPQFYRTVQGTEAGLNTDEWGSTLFQACLGGGRHEIAPDAAFDLRGHFLDCIEHGAAPVADVRWGLKVMAVAEAVFQSAATGEVVHMAPHKISHENP